MVGCVSLVGEDSWCFGWMGAKGPQNVIKLGHVYNLWGFGWSSNLYEIWIVGIATCLDRAWKSWNDFVIDRPLSANLGSIESSVYMCYVLAKYVLTQLLTSFFGPWLRLTLSRSWELLSFWNDPNIFKITQMTCIAFPLPAAGSGSSWGIQDAHAKGM